MRRRLLVVVTALSCLLPVVVMLAYPGGGNADPERFIVQAASVAVARQSVADAGGHITHELGIINAVGAELDDDQRAVVEATDGVRRVYRDSAVSTDSGFVSSCGIEANASLGFGSQSVRWKLINTGTRILTLTRLVTFWPKKNDELEGVYLGQTRLWSGEREGISASFDFDSARYSAGALDVAPGAETYV